MSDPGFKFTYAGGPAVPVTVGPSWTIMITVTVGVRVTECHVTESVPVLEPGMARLRHQVR